jgi:hypothetical protein
MASDEVRDDRVRLPDRPVGLAGFEPTTPCSQSRCATKLRHSPSSYKLIQINAGRHQALTQVADSWVAWDLNPQPTD